MRNCFDLHSADCIKSTLFDFIFSDLGFEIDGEDGETIVRAIEMLPLEYDVVDVLDTVRKDRCSIVHAIQKFQQ